MSVPVQVDETGQPLDPEMVLVNQPAEPPPSSSDSNESSGVILSPGEETNEIKDSQGRVFTLEELKQKRENALNSDEEDKSVSQDGLPKDFPLEVDEKSQHGTVRRFATIMNLVNSVLGAGILGVPNSMHNCGVLVGSILLLIVAIMTHFGSVLTLKLQYRTKAEGFDELAGITLGKFGMIVLPITVFLFSYSCMVTYLVVACDSIVSWFEMGGIMLQQMGNYKWYRALIVFVNSIVVPIPLCFPRSIKFLSYFSFITVICIFFYFIAMVVKSIQVLPGSSLENTVIAKGGMSLFSAISVYALAFCLPTVILPLVHDYNKNVSKRINVTSWAMALCTFLILVPNILAYLCIIGLGTEIKSNVLLSFASDDYLVFAVRIGFYLVVSFSFPVIGQSVMSSWSQIIFKKNDHAELDNKRRILVLLLTIVIPLVIAMFLSNIQPALSIGGAAGGAIDSFVFPPVMWVALSKRPKTSLKNVLMLIYAAFGFVVSVICIYQAFVDAITEFSK